MLVKCLKEKAKDIYKEMLTKHPGSVFIDESRAKYRELREVYPDKINKEDLFINKELASVFLKNIQDYSYLHEG